MLKLRYAIRPHQPQGLYLPNETKLTSWWIADNGRTLAASGYSWNARDLAEKILASDEAKAQLETLMGREDVDSMPYCDPEKDTCGPIPDGGLLPRGLQVYRESSC